MLYLIHNLILQLHNAVKFVTCYACYLCMFTTFYEAYYDVGCTTAVTPGCTGRRIASWTSRTSTSLRRCRKATFITPSSPTTRYQSTNSQLYFNTNSLCPGTGTGTLHCYNTSAPRRWLQLEFYFHSTAIRPPFDCSSYVTMSTKSQWRNTSVAADLFIYLGLTTAARAQVGL